MNCPYRVDTECDFAENCVGPVCEKDEDDVNEEEEGWYGKGCIHQCCQWEDNEETGGPDYKEAHPALIFCNHKSNADDREGNCSVEQCPQKREREREFDYDN